MSGTPPVLVSGGRPIPLAPGQTVLAALEADGTAPPASCRSGVCQSCLVRAVDGTPPPRSQAGLRPGQRARGLLMACVCVPTADLALAPLGAEDAPVPARLTARERRGDVLLLTVAAPGLQARGGQFLTLIRPDGLARPYSVAGCETGPGGPRYRLHVRVLPGGRMGGWLAAAPLGQPLSVQGPAGEAVAPDDPHCPLVLAGVGTGLAPLLGILDEADAAGHTAPVHLFVGARSAAGLYLAPALRDRAAATPRLRLHLGALDAQGVADVHEGRLEAAVLALARSGAATGAHHVLCGAPGWVRGLQRQLFLGGVSLARIHADAFVPAAP